MRPAPYKNTRRSRTPSPHRTTRASSFVGRRAIDAKTTLTYRGLLNEKERLDLQRADGQITAGVNSARDDAMALAEDTVAGGATDTKAKSADLAQGENLASLLKMDELTLCSYEMDKPQYQPILNVHDDLTFYLPKKTAEEDIEFIADKMCDCRYDFISVPIVIELAIGETWGALEDVAKFASNDNPNWMKWFKEK